MNNNLDILISYYFTLNKLASQLNSIVVTGIAYDILSKQSDLDEKSLEEITKKVISIAAVQDFYDQIKSPEQNIELVNKLGASLVNHVNDLMETETQVKISTAKGKYDHISFKPPKSVADTAAAGLKARQKAPKSMKGGLTPQEAKKQGIGSGVTRAVTLKNRKDLSPETIKRMFSFFSRHEKNKNTPRGRIAWCLTGKSEVLMADGSIKTIKEIVDNKITDSVISYNETTGKFEPKKITGWSVSDSTIEDFYIVGKGKTKRQGVSNKTLLAATAEHPFYVKGEWVETKDMGDKELPSVQYELDDVSNQILYGILLGDGSLYSNSSISANLAVGHGSSQFDYGKEISRLLNILTPVTTYSAPKSGYGAGKIQQLMKTKHFSFLKEIKNKLYKNNKKEITKEYLNNLNEIALAFMYMDDGQFKQDKRGSCSSIIIHTEGFDDSSRKNIKEWLKEKFNIESSDYNRSQCKGKAIYIGSKQVNNFMNLVAPYIHESMRYKLKNEFKNIEYKLADHKSSFEMKIQYVPVEKFHKATEYRCYGMKKPYLWNKRYNLEIEDNHNFIANGFLVHNCLWGGTPGFAFARKVIRQMEAADRKSKKKRKGKKKK